MMRCSPNLNCNNQLCTAAETKRLLAEDKRDDEARRFALALLAAAYAQGDELSTVAKHQARMHYAVDGAAAVCAHDRDCSCTEVAVRGAACALEANERTGTKVDCELTVNDAAKRIELRPRANKDATPPN